MEVDPGTGVVEIVQYTSIDDCGRAVNPMLVHGQSHGGIAKLAVTVAPAQKSEPAATVGKNKRSSDEGDHQPDLPLARR